MQNVVTGKDSFFRQCYIRQSYIRNSLGPLASLKNEQRQPPGTTKMKFNYIAEYVKYNLNCNSI